MLSDTSKLLIGECPCQSPRVYPSPRSVFPTNLPFDTSTSPFGIATLISISSTSSRHWSLFGHHILAPVSSHAVLIHSRPAGSFLNVTLPNLPVSTGFPE